MKLKLLAVSLFFAFLFVACAPTPKKQESKQENKEVKTKIRYAKGFSISHFTNYTQIIVRNPWDSTHILEKYILVDRNAEMPANLPEGVIVKVPVQRAAICSSVHIGMWNQLGKINDVVAVCEPKYIDFEVIKKGLASGKIIDLGMATSINIEKLVSIAPDVLVVSPYENNTHDRFKNSGIAVIKDASYMEESPLGRSEWIKFEAAFTGEDALAEKIFNDIEKRYQSLCTQVLRTKNRPTVFTEKKFGDSWYISGGNSYIGRFLKDAGANYMWADMKNAGSVPLSFEKVFTKAINADYWLIKYNDSQSNLTYKQLATEYELYANFKAFKKKNIFAMNSATCPFYEESPMEPDVVLADLVSIFHPEIMLDYKPKYYFKIQ